MLPKLMAAFFLAIVLARDVSLTQATSISGVVFDFAGDALPEVTVTLSRKETASVVTTTNTAGEFVFSNLAVGRYELRLEHPGYRTVKRDVRVRVGVPVSLRLTLEISDLANKIDTGAGTANENNQAKVPVFYATDRNRVNSPLGYGLSREPTTSLHLGRFVVSVPRQHEIGRIERPHLWSFRTDDTGQHFVIVKREELAYARFYSEIRSAVRRSSEKQAFVFIHGFNVSFDDAIYRTAQLAYDLGFDGAPILYSWPSVASVTAYRIDERNNEWTINHLRYFLEDVRQRTGATVIHLIAHSMGNRALAGALAEMAPPRGGQTKFSQVILTAPDIDAGLFPDLAARIRRVSERVTIYASNHDRALEAAMTYDTFQRVGSTTPQLVLAAGCDVVDASSVDTSLLGHSYVGDSSKVLSDLFYVIRGVAAGARAFISPRGQPPNTYWAFR